MRRRKLLLMLVGLAVVLCAAGAFALWPRESRVTLQNWQRIRIGMSSAEVEAILGPAGDYRTGEMQIVYGDGMALQEPPFSPPFSEQEIDEFNSLVLWTGDAGNLGVSFKSDKVCRKCFNDTKRIDQSALDNLLWRAKRQWRRWFPE